MQLHSSGETKVLASYCIWPYVQQPTTAWIELPEVRVYRVSALAWCKGRCGAEVGESEYKPSKNKSVRILRERSAILFAQEQDGRFRTPLGVLHANCLGEKKRYPIPPMQVILALRRRRWPSRGPSLRPLAPTMTPRKRQLL